MPADRSGESWFEPTRDNWKARHYIVGVGPSDCSPTCLSLTVVSTTFLGLSQAETHRFLRLRHYLQHRLLIQVLVAREQCGRVSFHPLTSPLNEAHHRLPPAGFAASSFVLGWRHPHRRGRSVPATQAGCDPSLSPTAQLTRGLSSNCTPALPHPDLILLAPSQRSKADCQYPFTRSAALRRHQWLPPALLGLPGRVLIRWIPWCCPR